MQAAPAAALDPSTQVGAHEDGGGPADEFDDDDLMSGQEDSGSDDSCSGSGSGRGDEETDPADSDAGSKALHGEATDRGRGMEVEGASAAAVDETGTADSTPSAAPLPGNGDSALEDTLPPRTSLSSAYDGCYRVGLVGRVVILLISPADEPTPKYISPGPRAALYTEVEAWVDHQSIG